MSRNIGSTLCAICSGDVVLEEAPRPITAAETGRYSAEYLGRLTCANASCECGAKYIAWVRLAGSFGHLAGDDRPFVDLSFRAAFNDEPAPEDLPSKEVLQAEHERACLAQARDIERQIEELKAERTAIYDRAATECSRWESYRREGVR